MFLPHQLIGQVLDRRFDQDVRRHFFKGMEFDAPQEIRAGSARTAPYGTCTRTPTR